MKTFQKELITLTKCQQWNKENNIPKNLQKRLPDRFKSKNKSGVARDLGIIRISPDSYSMLRQWEQEFNQSEEKAFLGKGNPKDEEMAALKKENLRLKEELEIQEPILTT